MKMKTFKEIIKSLPDTAEICIGEPYGDETYKLKAIYEDSEDTGYGGYHIIVLVPMPHLLDTDDLEDGVSITADKVIYNTEDEFELLSHRNNISRAILTNKGELKEVEK